MSILNSSVDSSADSSPADSSPADSSRPRQVSGFEQLTHFVGFDWAKDSHQVVVVDRLGKVVMQLNFADSAEGWAKLREQLAGLVGFAGFALLGVCIETCQGPAVERLLEIGTAIYPVNPKAAESYRDRKRPSGCKDDTGDAWSFGDALRVDGQHWRQLRPMDQATLELRLLCRDEIALIEQRTALINQLKAALHEYYPVVLRSFEDWTITPAWKFVIAFPTPVELARAGKRKWEKFLHTHKLYRPQTAQKRLDLFAGSMLFVNPNPAVTASKSFLAVSLAEQLLNLQNHLDRYRKRIEELFMNHPDHDVFGSLPGAGKKLAPRLLGEIGQDREVFQSAQGLACYAGAAPVTKQSGRSKQVIMRRACNMTLRATVHLWSDLSRSQCAWAQVYYLKKKQQGMHHAAALRCLGQRWLKILWRMWQDHKIYNENHHTQNQVKHGSWVIRLLNETAVKIAT